jgi:glycosyltransferase involved in cell wall biosynthesis
MVENVFVVMPAYNAGATIEKVFARIPKGALRRITRYVVVDDGSTDDTRKALTRIAADFPNLDVLVHKRNLGYGAAEKTLLNHAVREGAEAAVLLHSDGQYSPESIPDMLTPFDNNEADLIQGSRMLKKGALQGGMPFYKYVANRCLTAIENRGFGMKMAEYHSGYMLYSRDALLAIPFEKFSNSFDFDLEMIVAAKVLGLRISQIPIPTIYAEEVSYLNPIKYGLDVLNVVIRYRKGSYHDLLGIPHKV